MRERKVDEELVLYKFRPCGPLTRPIELKPTRRKNDPKGFYAPIADLKDPVMKLAWDTIKAGQTLLDPKYVQDALRIPVSLEDFLKGYHPFQPGLMNTVLIEYRDPPKIPWINYGVFLLYQEKESIFIKEVYTLSINKETDRKSRHKKLATEDHYVFGHYAFEQYQFDGVSHYAHHLHYRGHVPSMDLNYFFRSCLVGKQSESDA